MVTLDVAGMYYRKDVEVDEGATVEDVMLAAQASNGPRGAQLDFETETINGETFLDSITVTHQGKSARSGQNKQRIYPDGTYEYYDDDVILNKKTGLFEPKDPTREFVLAWQYYVYDNNGNDLSRFGGEARKVVPFTRSDTEYAFEARFAPYTVVWRLIAIWLRPSYGDSLKVAMRMS